jgi:hypothetical protein
MTRKFFCVCFCLLALLPAPPSRAGEKPTRLSLEAKDVEEALGVGWYGIYFQGKKIGWFMSSTEREGTGPDSPVVSRLEMVMKLTSFGQKAEMRMTQRMVFESKAPYRLLTAESVEIDDKSKQTVRLKRIDSGYEQTTITGEKERKRNIPPIEYTLEDSLSADVWLRRGAKPGEEILTRSFSMRELEVDLSRTKLLATKTSLVSGVKVTFHELEVTNLKTKLTTLAKMDQRGRLLSGKVGDLFELRRESEQDAKNTEFSNDIFLMGMAKVDRALGDSKRLTGVVLEVKGKEGALLPNGPCQCVIEKEMGVYHWKLGKDYGKPIPATAKDLEDNLKETTNYPIHDPKLRQLVERAVGDATTAEEKVKRIVKYVHGFVKPSLAASVPRLHELMEHREGDCKSYALLFVVMARAAGVPAREVSGLVYVGDDIKAFGGHAWNEVVLNGRWVPIDASIGDEPVNATHICFGTDRESSALLTTLGKLSFRVVDVQQNK